MNSAHLHLLVNHVPIIGGAFASLLLLWGILKGGKPVIYAALAMLILCGVASGLAMNSGEGAEEVLENPVYGVSEQAMHAHEEAAEFANWFMIAVSVLSLATLAVSRLRERRIFHIILLVLSLGANAAMARTGFLGGKIRHTEISGAAGGQATEQPGGEEEDDD
ncbi:MAG: hypothetical protein U0176_22820 [Bacteroidia bacterium]